VYGSVIVTLLPNWSTNLAQAANLPREVYANVPLILYGVVLIVVIVLFRRHPGACAAGGPLCPYGCSTMNQGEGEIMAFSGHRRATIALTVALTLAVSACAGGGGSGSTPGITDTTVTVGGTLPLTGTAAPGYSEQGRAAKAFFDYVNAGGGVNGRKITFKYLDDGYNPANTVTLTKQLVLQENVFAMLGALGTPTHTKVVDFLNSSRVPDLFVASGCTCWDQPQQHPYTYGWQPDYAVEGKILGDYIKKNFAGKKVAYFYQDDDFGHDGMKGLDKYLDPASVVTRQPYQPGNTTSRRRCRRSPARARTSWCSRRFRPTPHCSSSAR
jgi:ABC-type branched-subunit amino acid transport system substrate-binding protein